jgi:WD40 repeat protein
MKPLQLILECAGKMYQLDTDEDMLIGACVEKLIVDSGYPRVDSLGSPVRYQLRVASQPHPLPGERRFAEVGMAPQTRVVLESAMATYATQPMTGVEIPGMLPAATATSQMNRTGRRWFLAGLSITLFGISGFGLGMASGVVPRLIWGQTTRTKTSTAQPTSSNRFMPRTASIRLHFDRHMHTVQSLSWSPLANVLASGSDGGELLIWQAADGAIDHRVRFPAAVPALAWSSDGQRLVTGSANQVAFYTLSTQTLFASQEQPHTAPITALAWTSQNLQQVVSGSLDQRAIIWNTTSDAPAAIFTKHAAAIEDVSWSPDGLNVASCSQGGLIRVWNAQSVQEIHAPFQDGQRPVRTIAFSPAETMLAAGGDDGVVRLWENGLLCITVNNTRDGPVCQDTPVRQSSTSMGALRALAWSPDGRFLASGTSEGICTLWSRATLQPLLSFAAANGLPINKLSWSPTGNEIVMASGSQVTIWTFGP